MVERETSAQKGLNLAQDFTGWKDLLWLEKKELSILYDS
jgi:hypothetical protein